MGKGAGSHIAIDVALLEASDGLDLVDLERRVQLLGSDDFEQHVEISRGAKFNGHWLPLSVPETVISTITAMKSQFARFIHAELRASALG